MIFDIRNSAGQYRIPWGGKWGGGKGGEARVIIPFVDNQSECAYWLSIKYSIFIYIK